MMYLINFSGEAVVNADDEEQAVDFLKEDLALPMCDITIEKIKELD